MPQTYASQSSSNFLWRAWKIQNIENYFRASSISFFLLIRIRIWILFVLCTECSTILYSKWICSHDFCLPNFGVDWTYFGIVEIEEHRNSSNSQVELSMVVKNWFSTFKTSMKFRIKWKIREYFFWNSQIIQFLLIQKIQFSYIFNSAEIRTEGGNFIPMYRLKDKNCSFVFVVCMIILNKQPISMLWLAWFSPYWKSDNDTLTIKWVFFSFSLSAWLPSIRRSRREWDTDIKKSCRQTEIARMIRYKCMYSDHSDKSPIVFDCLHFFL